MAEIVQHHTYANGLTLLTQAMPHVRSATFALHLPAGLCRETPDQRGVGTLLAESIVRGAGNYGSKQLSVALDNLGVDRSESIGLFNLSLAAGTLGRNVPAALKLYADVVRRPHLPEGELEAAKELMLLDLAGLEDSPQEKVMLELKRRIYPEPFGRNQYGTPETIDRVTIDHVRAFYTTHLRPHGAIFSVAGAIDPDEIRALVGELFGDWSGTELPDPQEEAFAPTSVHLEKETQQTQVALAVPSAPFTDVDYYAARGVVGVLSGGMSSRLFTEVREKRGLCYSVSAGHDTANRRGALVCYAGTRIERAQETLDVMLAELRRLTDGVAVEELDRLKTSLKTALVMQQESTGARAAAMAGDWFHLKRVRSLDEIVSAVNAIDDAAIQRYLERFPIRNPTVVTLGPTPLTIPV